MGVLRIGAMSIACLTAAALVRAGDEKELTGDEVIARHVDSIGTSAARAAAGGRVIKGKVTYTRRPTKSDDTFAGRNTVIIVPVTLAFGGPRSLIDLRYGWKDYPFDRIVHDGKRVKNARMLAPGNYSVIAGLLVEHQFLLKAGILGGPLATGWALLDAGSRFEKVKYAGLKKQAGQPAHRLDVRLKSDPEHEIAFFFEPDSFRLLHTEIWIGPNGRLRLDESFSDYRAVKELSLPHAWRVQYEAPSDLWEFALDDFNFAAELPEEAFVTE